LNTASEMAVVIQQKRFCLSTFFRQRHRVRAGVDAGEHVHLLDVEQALGLVDRDLRLGLAVAVDADDLVTCRARRPSRSLRR